MSGLSHFAIQIQSWFVKTKSKSKHGPKFFSNVKSKSKFTPKILKNAAFSQQKCRISFPLTQSKSGPDPKFWSDLQSESNTNSTKFAIVRIQSNPSPAQCSSLKCTCQSRSTECSHMGKANLPKNTATAKKCQVVSLRFIPTELFFQPKKILKVFSTLAGGS